MNELNIPELPNVVPAVLPKAPELTKLPALLVKQLQKLSIHLSRLTIYQKILKLLSTNMSFFA